MKPDEIDNPAWDYIKTVPNDTMFRLHPEDTRFMPSNYSLTGSDFKNYRDGVTCLWTWAIPDPTVLHFLQERMEGCKVVEIGAGNGYWAYLLTQLGMDVNAYDIAPMSHKDTWFETVETARAAMDAEPEKGYGRRLHALEEMAEKDLGEPREWHPVIKAGAEALDLPENHDRILFLCWPPYSNPMAADAIKAFKGNIVVYIGENGGCNGDEDFHDLVGWDNRWDDDANVKRLPQVFKEIDYHPMIQWSGLHDNLTVFERIVPDGV